MVSAPYCVLAFALTIAMATRMFGVQPLADDEARAAALERVERFDPWETVKDRRFFFLSAAVLVLFVLGFALKDVIPVLREMGLEVVAFTGATVMLVLYPTDVEEVLDRVEWSLVFFFVGLFALIGVMEHAGVLEMIGEWLSGPLGAGPRVGPITLLWASAFFSGITDNIPLAAVLGKVLLTYQLPYQEVLWWGLLFGASLGGNLTPIGAASTVIAITIIRKEGIELTFLGYTKTGAIFVVAQLTLASVYLVVAHAIGFLGG